MFVTDHEMKDIQKYIEYISNDNIAGYSMGNDECCLALEAAKYIVKEGDYDCIYFGHNKYQIDCSNVFDMLETDNLIMNFEGDSLTVVYSDVFHLISDGHLALAEQLANALMLHAIFDRCIDMIIKGHNPIINW